jgi:hypothetical protein
MFKFLLRNGCDISKRDQHGESVRDSLQRYCQQTGEPPSDMVKTFRKHEARLMINSLTQDASSNIELVLNLTRNFRSDFLFAKEAFKLILTRLLGPRGVPYFYHICLFLFVQVMSYELYKLGGFGFWSLEQVLPSYFFLFGGWYYVYKLEDGQKIKKLHITRDSREPDHLI